MIFSDDVVFIHIPRTGGSSCSHYLLRCLRGPIHNCHAGAAKETARIDRRCIHPHTDVNRHCSLRGAERHIRRLTGQSLAEKRLLLAVVRHPFALEYSFYMHLRKPNARKRRMQVAPEQVRLARGDFRSFVARAGYFREGMRQEDYFLLDGDIPANLKLLKFEDLPELVPRAVAPFAREDKIVEFPHRNRSAASEAGLHQLLDEETRELIRRKHSWLFERGYYSFDLPA